MISNIFTKKISLLKNFSLFFFLILVVLVPSKNSFALPPLFQDELVKSGFQRPTSMTSLPDGRILVIQKSGEILILNPSLVSPVAAPYLNITDINTVGERGLIDIVIDPSFPVQPYIYVVYHTNSDKRIRISRFTHQGNTASLSSEFVVWKDPNEYTHRFHHGGGLSFGPDGHLYLTTGEQFAGFKAQDLSNAAGKIIRVARDGSIPADNPFVGQAGKLDEIWAYGLRNPWRARWDLPTSGTIGPRLFIGEVGGNLGSSNEDIHIGKKGANYGWPFCEGNTCNNSNAVYDKPLFTYEHLSRGASVIGGIVYHGSQFPTLYSGVYFYGDYAIWSRGRRGVIRYLTFDNNGNVSSHNPFLDNGPGEDRFSGGLIVDVKEGKDGALYYIQVASSENFLANTGTLRRIIYNDGNQAPQITSATANVTNGETPLTVQFRGTAIDAENDSLQYLWLFGDGDQAAGANVSHTYTTNGSFQASLHVSDSSKTTISNPPITIVAGSKPEVTITEPSDGSLFRAGQNIDYSAFATDDGLLTENSYKWTVLFVHNDHTHPELGPISGSSGTLHTPNSGHSFFDNTGFEVSVEVTDQDGVSTNKNVRIFPEKVDITFNSQPNGISFFIDGTIITSPIVYDTAIGFIHNLTAPQITCLNGTQKYRFVNWSNGESASQIYNIPDRNETLTAVYTADGVCDANTNLSPLAFADEVTAASNSSRTFNVLENDVDTDGNIAANTVLISRYPQHGQITVNSSTGAVSYSHDGSAMTSDSFTYTVEDNQGAVSNEATVLITISSSSGSCGKGLELDGVNDLVNIPKFNLASDFTIESWVKLAAGIDSKDGVFGDGIYSHLYFASGKPKLYSYGSRITANTAIPVDTWTHIAVTRSGTNLKMYINGVEDATGRYNGTFIIKSLGKGYRGFFEGMMDEVRVWNVARTSAEINQSYETSVDPSTTGLIGYWAFNGTDQTITDVTSLENHGSLGLNLTEGVDDPVRLDSSALPIENCDDGGFDGETDGGGGNNNNDAPVANNDTLGPVQIGGTLSFTVTGNDTDNNNNLDPASVVIVTTPNAGNVTINNSGVITYTHTGSAAITDIFTYNVKDLDGEISNIGTVSVVVADSNSTNNESSTVVDEFNNRNDIGSWVIQRTFNPSTFSYSVSPEKINMNGGAGNQNLTRLNTNVDPNRPYTMKSKFKFTSSGGINAFAMLFLQDNGSESDKINTWGINIDLNASGKIKPFGFKNGSFLLAGTQRNAPWVRPDIEYIYQVDVNRRLDGTVSSKWITAKITDNSNGEVKDHFEVYYGNFGWQPNLNEPVRIGLNSHGADWEVSGLTVKYTDNLQYTNNPPQADAGSDQVVVDSNNNGSEVISLNGSLSSDPEGDNLTYSWTENSIALGSGQNINHSFNQGIHFVTLTVNDGQGNTASDVVTISINGGEVNPANNPPIAQADTATIQRGGSLTIDVLTNDSDSDGSLNKNSLTIVNGSSSGTVVINSVTGKIVYSHDNSASTTDSFTYKVKDNQGADSNVTTVSINILESVTSCGRGLDLDGVNDWINIPDLTLSGDFTLESWVKLAPGIDYKDALFGQEGYGPDVHFLEGKVRLYAYGVRITSSIALRADTWEHIAITRAGSKLTIYINGVNRGIGSWNGSLSLKAIGRGNRGFFGGAIDDVRIWDIARSETEIVGNYETSVASNSPSLIGNWSMNGIGQTVTDSSSFAKHGSLGLNTTIGTDDPVRMDLTDNCDGGGNTTGGGSSNVAPLANNDISSVQNGEMVNISVLANDRDSDGSLNNSSLVIINQPNSGSVVINSSGTLTYTHNGSASTSDSFTYRVTDNQGAESNIATVSVNITAW